MKFRKKPVIIEAFIWTGDPFQKEDPMWIVDAIKAGEVYFTEIGSVDCKLAIKTLEGIMLADSGDYIIKGIKGEIYPCKPDIFEASYEQVSDLLEVTHG